MDDAISLEIVVEVIGEIFRKGNTEDSLWAKDTLQKVVSQNLSSLPEMLVDAALSNGLNLDVKEYAVALIKNFRPENAYKALNYLERFIKENNPYALDLLIDLAKVECPGSIKTLA